MQIADAIAQPDSNIASRTNTNSFGDIQLPIDLVSDKLIAEALLGCPTVGGFCSEENPKPQMKEINAPFFVSFDPLDGSSIYSSNFTVGSFFAVWDLQDVVGWLQRRSALKIEHMKMAIMAIYGPKTKLVVKTQNQKPLEMTFDRLKGAWITTVEEFPTISPVASSYALANLRAAFDCPGYKEILQNFVNSKKTLRYSGGMVPDVFQILCKGEGVFISPLGKETPKLRVFFEIAPTIFIFRGIANTKIFHCGKWVDDLEIDSVEMRSGLIVGSCKTVDEMIQSLTKQV